MLDSAEAAACAAMTDASTIINDVIDDAVTAQYRNRAIVCGLELRQNLFSFLLLQGQTELTVLTGTTLLTLA